MPILKLDAKLQKYFAKESSPFSAIMSLKGEIFRSVKNRETIRVVLDGQAYFIKKHFGITGQELIKNLLRCKLPITSAKNEWLAIQKLQSIGIPTMTLAGYGQSGRQSFVITEELPNTISMEDLGKSWRKIPPIFSSKKNYVEKIASTARILHNSGLCHRDFYICHFLLNPNTNNLYLIDLHRVQIHKKLPNKLRIKDLAALYFSVMDFSITQRDILRFISNYFNQPWRKAIMEHKKILHRVKLRAQKLYLKHTNPMRNFRENWLIKKNWRRYSICNLADNNQEMESLLANPDSYIVKGELLIGEDVNSVAKISLAGHALVVKRYNNRNLWFAFKRAFAKSRAKRCWHNAHKLLALNILTPKPIAIIEERFGPIHFRSYYITEFVDGINAQTFFLSNYNYETKLIAAKNLIKLLNSLCKAHIRHGDTKANNFLIKDEKVYLTDLDGMAQYSKLRYNLSNTFAKDRERFLRCWQKHPDILQMFLKIYGL